MTTLHIFNASIILYGRILKRASLTIKNSKIAAINRPAPKDAVLINAYGSYLSPGFIDTHIHGRPEEIIKHETKHGTTSSIIAVSCGRPAPNIKAYRNVLGVRLEGPYINPTMAGAQNRRFIITSSRAGMPRLVKSFGKELKMMTLAPELSGAERLIRFCRKNGVTPSIGHSNASYVEAKRSFDIGIRHATHLFNAMSGPRHGTAGAGLAALFDKRVTVEVIADLKHVHPGLLRLVFAVKDMDKIILITDSVRAEILSYPKRSRRLNAGYVCGCSHMIDCVKNVVTHCGISLADAVRMASYNPARLFGAAGWKGSISSGKDADLVLFDKNFNVKFTFIGGRMVYQKKD